MRYNHIKYKDSFGKWHNGYFSETLTNKICEGLYNGETSKITDYIGDFSLQDIKELRAKTKERGVNPLPIYN